MTRVLVVNAGSSSIKLSVLGDDDAVERTENIENWDGSATDARVAAFLAGIGGAGDVDAFDAVGHRVVHGGTEFSGPALIDGRVEAAIATLVHLAPLHQPRAIAGIAAVRRVFPDVPQVACFDTAFHASMPDDTSTYALPREWRERWPLRRFGFHGLSHAYASRRAVEMGAGTRIVTCHLGAGASLCAVLDGRSIDTTMGFTPLEGLVMATRSGSIDPGVVTWLIGAQGLSAAEVDDALTHRSGVLGLAATADMREVVARRADGDADARLAFDVYVHRLAAEIAAMTASLRGLDALVFTGGVGEHSAEVRAATCERLAFLDIAIDPALAVDGDAEITRPGARARTFVVTAREDLEIAHQMRRYMSIIGM